MSALNIEYDAYGMHNMSDAEYSAPLTREHFKETMERSKVVVINFMAPWCAHFNRLPQSYACYAGGGR